MEKSQQIEICTNANPGDKELLEPRTAQRNNLFIFVLGPNKILGLRYDTSCRYKSAEQKRMFTGIDLSSA